MKSFKELTYEELYDLYINQNLSYSSLSEKFNVPKHTVKYTIKKFGIVKENPSNGLARTDINKTELEVDIKSGMSINSIAKKYNCSNDYVAKQKARLGLSDKYKDEILEYYINQNLSFKETANRIGISENSLIQYCNIYQIVKNKQEKKYIDKNILYHEYVELKRNREDIYKEYGYTMFELNDMLKKWNITRDNHNKKEELSYDVLYDLYIAKQMSFNSVCDYLKTSSKRVRHYLKLYNIIKSVDDVSNDRIKHNLEKYGTKNTARINLDKETIEIIEDKNKLIEYIDTNNIVSIKDLSTKLNYSLSSLYLLIHEYELEHMFNIGHNNISDIERSVAEYIKTLVDDVETNTYTVLGTQELDIYVPSHKIAIEFNGTYWHSAVCKDKYYHIKKSKACEKLGIRLIHIYEYEWNNQIQQEKIKSMLRIAFCKTNTKIYARQCEIREISNDEAKPFNDKNHLQGHRNARITYGLFYKNMLVQLMSFSKNRKYEWEIIRGCPASNNVVVGGISKLFNHFIKQHNPSEIFSYCDFNKFDGHGYESLGMKFIGYSGPDLTWIIDNTPVKRMPTKHHQLKELANFCIWGSGSKKYLWKKEC